METSVFELLFLAVTYRAIAFAQFKKAESSRQRLAEGTVNEVTCCYVSAR